MVARALVLIAAVLALAWAARAQEPGELAGLRGELELGAFDERLAALEALLADPVHLDDGDLDRLLSIPGIGSHHVEALAEVAPPASVAELERLPGWDAALARRVAPFVIFGAHRRASRTELVLDLRPRAARVAGRVGSARGEALVPRSERRPRGGVSLRGGGMQVAGGDLRLDHALGRLAASGGGGFVEPPQWRRVGSLWIATARTWTRTLRGVGAAHRGRRTAAALVAGAQHGERALIAAAGWQPAPRAELQGAVVAHGGERGASLALLCGGAAGHAAFEAARSGGWAAAATVEVRRAGLRLRAGAEGRDGGFRAPFGVGRTSESRGAQRRAIAGLGARGQERDVEISVARERTSSGIEPDRTRTELSGRGRARWGRATLEIRGGQGSERTWRWEDPTAIGPQGESRRGLVLSASRPLRGSWVGEIEWRMQERGNAAGGAHRGGRAFGARAERQRGILRAAVAIGTFDVEPGVDLASPAIGRTLEGPGRRGDGVDAAGLVRLLWRGLDAELGGAARWASPTGMRAVLHWRVVVRLP